MSFPEPPGEHEVSRKATAHEKYLRKNPIEINAMRLLCRHLCRDLRQRRIAVQKYIHLIGLQPVLAPPLWLSFRDFSGTRGGSFKGWVSRTRDRADTHHGASLRDPDLRKSLIPCRSDVADNRIIPVRLTILRSN